MLQITAQPVSDLFCLQKLAPYWPHGKARYELLWFWVYNKNARRATIVTRKEIGTHNWLLFIPV